jgi:hypothetical protein
MPIWADETGTWADAIGDWNAEDVETFPPVGSFVFEPPMPTELPRVSYPISRADERFWSHFRRGPVGQNVFKLTDGTYTFTQPANNTDVAIWYLGGHIYPVDAAEKAALEAAGFTVSGPTVAPSEAISWDDEVGVWADLSTNWADV